MLTKDDFEQIGRVMDAKIKSGLAPVTSQLHGLEQRLTGVEKSLRSEISGLEQRLTGVEQRLTGVEQRLTGVEKSLRSEISGLEQRLHKEIQESATRVTEEIAALIRDEVIPMLAERHESLEARVERIEEELGLPARPA